MPSTDIDGTPFLPLRADDVIRLLGVLRGTGRPLAARRARAYWVSKFKRFCEDPQVTEWINTQRENDA